MTKVWGIDDIQSVLANTNIKCKAEHSFTPDYLVSELNSFERAFFKIMFTGSFYRKIYRLYELEL